MNKEVITKKQMQLLIFSYCIGAYLLFSLGGKVKQHAWAVTLIGMVMSIPIILMYGRILDLYPQKNFYQVITEIFGKKLGTILNIIPILHMIFLGAYILNDFIDFIKLTALFNTPKFVTMLFIGVLSIWILRSGIEVLSAWSHFFIRKIIIFVILTWILLIPQMQTINIYPIIFIDFKTILKESFAITAFPFTEVFIFVGFFDYIKGNEKSKNIFLKPLIIGGIFVTISTIINIMLIGGESYSHFYYSGYESIKRLKWGGEFQRIEIVVSIAFTIIQFLETTYCILSASKGIEEVFSLNDYRDILIPVVFLLLNLSYIMFSGITEAMEFVVKYWPTYGFFVQMLFPFFIFISGIIKKKFFGKSSGQ